MNGFDDQLRAEMRHATDGVQAPDGLAAAAGAGGRRRLRRRRAVQTAPIAAAIAGVAGVAVLAPQLGGRGAAPTPTVVGAPGAEPLKATTALQPAATATATPAPTGTAPTSGASPAPSGDTTFVVPDSWPAFFAAGYDYDDAVALAALWHTASVEDAKTRAGQELTAGATLPIAPGSAPAAPDPSAPAGSTADGAAVDAFFAAGYDYADAVTLAGLWGGDPYEAKVSAGRELLAGATLPVAP